jgi:regulator of PEP synthase PpsR (kinase-PPPase family)
MDRSVFFVSDHTCITAETVGRSLLSQFPAFRCQRHILPFTDTEAKLDQACQRIAAAFHAEGQPPLVFSTLADARLRDRLKASGAVVFDLFDSYIERLETALGLASDQAVGRAHGLGDPVRGRERIEALKFTLDTDDGLRLDAYGEADIVLAGVSRSGKTPACLFLALQYGIAAANYPLTEEDLARAELPQALQGLRGRLLGLSLAPERLSRLRGERKPGSRYATLAQCRHEIHAAEALFKAAGIPWLDTSNLSVEEIAANVLHRSGLKRREW